MDVLSTQLNGVKILVPKFFEDQRGYFSESYNRRAFEAQVGPVDFCQDNQSLSHLNVIRGLHFQSGTAVQSKLLWVLKGKVWDVVVDLRKSSPTFKQWAGFEISSENRHQLFVPKGFAHGYLTMADDTIVAYKVDAHFSPGQGRGIRFDDPQLKIDWPLTGSPVLSANDKRLPGLNDVEVFD